MLNVLAAVVVVAVSAPIIALAAEFLQREAPFQGKMAVAANSGRRMRRLLASMPFLLVAASFALQWWPWTGWQNVEDAASGFRIVVGGPYANNWVTRYEPALRVAVVMTVAGAGLALLPGRPGYLARGIAASLGLVAVVTTFAFHGFLGSGAWVSAGGQVAFYAFAVGAGLNWWWSFAARWNQPLIGAAWLGVANVMAASLIAGFLAIQLLDLVG